MEDTASKSNVPSKSLRKKPLFKKSLYSTRGRKPVEDTTATKESFFQSPSVSQSKEVEEKKNEKQRTTRKLGISSMRLTNLEISKPQWLIKVLPLRQITGYL